MLVEHYLRHGLVLREGMSFPVAGLVIGVAASLAVTRLLQSSAYAISPQESRVFVGRAALLVVVAAAACLVPAWRDAHRSHGGAAGRPVA